MIVTMTRIRAIVVIAPEKFERSLHLLENTTRGKSSLSCTWLSYWGSGSASGFSYLATIGYHQELGLYSQRSHTESFSAFWPRVNWRESENSPGQIAEKFRRLLKTGPRKRTDISRNRLCSSLPAQLISFPIAHVKKKNPSFWTLTMTSSLAEDHYLELVVDHLASSGEGDWVILKQKHTASIYLYQKKVMYTTKSSITSRCSGKERTVPCSWGRRGT